MIQSKSFHNIAVVHKPAPSVAAELAYEVGQWCEERGCRVHIFANAENMPLHELVPDIILVLGGDGTMLGVARAMVTQPTPLLGINLGKVGFLAELRTNNWQEGLTKLLAGECRVLERAALQWRVLRDNACVAQGIAVNDAVLSRGALSRVISIAIRVDGQPVCRVRSDGIIFSTPTGATGYAVSAGGPLVHPELSALTITPICPFLCNFPPMVLPDHVCIQAEVMTDAVESFFTLDGQANIPLAPLDVVEVTGLTKSVQYARIGQGTYFTRLKARGFIEEYVGHPLSCEEV